MVLFQQHNRHQALLSSEQYLRCGNVFGVVQCLSQIQTRYAVKKSSLNSFCEYNLSGAVPGSPDPLPPVPSHHAAQRITLCGENATDQGG